MTHREYDFWLFDLDGTLVDTEPSHARRVFDRVGDRIDRAFTDREVEILWHGLGGERNRTLQSWGIAPDEFWAALHEIEDPQVRAEATFLHDDAARLLRNVDGPIGIVTHCQSYLTEPVLDRLDVRDWFDTVVCCTPDVGWKPDPAPVERAIDRLGVDDPTNGIMVGDGPPDVGAAWNADLDAAHVERHGHERRGLCVPADYRVRTLDELLSRGRNRQGEPKRIASTGDR